MRIEHYGTIQAEPPYQHVGYTAAAVIASYSRFSSDMTFLFGSLVLAVTLAAMAARRTRVAWQWPAVAAVLIVIAGTAVAHYTGHFETNSLQPQFYTTIYRLEDLSARTDAWIDEHGRLPTQAEWEAIEKGESELDGWQYPFQYQPLGQSNGKDGQEYIIISIGKAPKKDDRALRSVWAIPSWLLGRDGVFGTWDDDSSLRSALTGVNLRGHRYPHAREPRTGR
jgi:hypothetical protein